MPGRITTSATAPPSILFIQFSPATQPVLLRGVRRGQVQSMRTGGSERLLLSELPVRGSQCKCPCREEQVRHPRLFCLGMCSALAIDVRGIASCVPIVEIRSRWSRPTHRRTWTRGCLPLSRLRLASLPSSSTATTADGTRRKLVSRSRSPLALQVRLTMS